MTLFLIKAAFVIIAIVVARSDDLRRIVTKESLESCSYEATCTVSGIQGVCISSGCCSGKKTSNICHGSKGIDCCTNNKCTTPFGSGTCKQTTACADGTSYSGYCTGPANLQCCVRTSSTGISSTKGIDFNASLSSSVASCLVSSGYSFVIPRAYQSNGQVDPNVCTSLKNAYNAGVKYRDVYMLPCPNCSSTASNQMNQMLSYIRTYCPSQWSGRVWLYIEGSQYWLGSYSSNENWYEELVNSCSTFGVKCGVYSSAADWSAIFGSATFVYGNNLPLWYAHYDNNTSFTDFVSFGGWTSPYAKQYAGTSTVCG